MKIPSKTAYSIEIQCTPTLVFKVAMHNNLGLLAFFIIIYRKSIGFELIEYVKYQCFAWVLVKYNPSVYISLQK